MTTMNERPIPLPESGLYLIDDWCAIGGCCRKSVLRTIKDYDIDVINTPGMTVIDAAVWWSTIRKSAKAKGAKR